METHTFKDVDSYLGAGWDPGTKVYLASDVDAKFKEYDDDNLALSQSISKLGASIGELEKALREAVGYVEDCRDLVSSGESEAQAQALVERIRSLMESVTK